MPGSAARRAPLWFCHRGRPTPVPIRGGVNVSSLPMRRADIVRRNVEEELVLFDPENQRAHFLNPTADLIWELCDGARSVENIAEKVTSRFEVAPARAMEDVRGTLEEFRRKRLLLA